MLIMKRHTKKRLFEVLAKVDKSFKPSLGPKMYVKATDIPPQIIAWAKSIIGNTFLNKITVQKSNGMVEIGMPWHDADRETHKYFKLTDNGADEMGDQVSRSGWSEVNMGDKYGTTPIPSGYVLATVGTYPKRLEIVTNTDAMNILPDNSALDKLSDEALVALYQAKSFKSPYRQKFADSVYQELISLGLMNSQKAITIEGRNLANSPEVTKRIEDIGTKDREENGWSTKYRLH
jgi:hypothetical protein